MTYFLVVDSWNIVVSRFTDYDVAVRCARANKGYVVPMKLSH